MLGMSRAGLAERWTLFVGALLSVALGVALVQSSLLLLISAATFDPPPGVSEAERMQISDGATAAVSMLGVVLGGAVFLAGFVISSTFAFTVDQRRRDLALLRLVGGGRGHVRRLLLGEALLLGLAGAGLGIPAGLQVMALQAWLMRRFEFVPEGFTGQWRMWILGVSFGTGILLAVAGVLVAARRAARVRPLEALRESGPAARVMTAGRWIAGLIFLGGALALMIVAPHGGPSGGVAMAMNVAMPASVAVVAFAPLLVPLIARLMPVGGGVLGSLARASVRDARRRSASVAAPLIVLVALVVGNTAAGVSFTASGVDELKRTTHADFVVEGRGPAGAVPGVAAVSTELALPGEVTYGEGEYEEVVGASVLVVDPAAYSAIHGTPVTLAGRTAVAGPGGDVPRVGPVRLRLPGGDLGELPVTGSVPAALSGGASLLLPRGLVPEAQLAEASAVSFVALEPGADRAAVRAALARTGPVSDLDDWLRADAATRDDTNRKVMLIVLGLGGLYALIGVVNAIVIGAATRRREFAEARVTGLTRGQVIRAALLEAYAVTGAGLVLGALAAGGAFIAVLATTSAVTGTANLDIPWTLVGGVVLVALTVTGLTSLITSWSATRRAPVTLLAARE
ncbi:ABC transporter permease [Paractinoplanes lichenicola]|uniref:ABC transporter permease n=1 Tax=Paractinoplanes lichenicola TaxID=2802976 RepID=A0ABS1W436_9ACTN|nr:ABC transporter permease [Actinoplanes lichenicola]MBL7261318.1 ABC transporter permease [Actinoplanes lichenicola]